MIEIIEAKPTDAIILASLARQTFLESHGESAAFDDLDHYLNKAYNEKTMQEELSKEINKYKLIYYQKQLAGFSNLKINTPCNFRSEINLALLDRIYILREFYDLKLGLALYLNNIDFAKKAEQAGIWLYTWVGNQRAIRFYEKAGFTIIGNADFVISPNHSNPNHIMFLKF